MVRSGPESHGTARSPHDSEHAGRLRVHGNVDAHAEEAGKFRASTLHLHPERESLRVAGIDHPRSIAIKDRQHRVERVAHHLLEVVRSLDGSVDLIHALQEPEMSLALLFCPLALDRDTRKIGDLVDDILLLSRGTSRFAGVYRERSQYPAIQGEHRRRPTRAEPVWQSQIPIVGPQWILGDIGDDDWCFAVRGRSARSRGRTDGGAVDRFRIALWQARRGAVPEAIAIRVQ